MKKLIVLCLAAAGCATSSPSRKLDVAEVTKPAPEAPVAMENHADAVTRATGPESERTNLYAEALRGLDDTDVHEKARHLIERLGRVPDDVELRVELGRLLLNHGYPALAIAPVRDALFLRPGHPAAVAVLADALIRSGRADEAAKLAVQLVDDRPSDASRWVFLAEVSRRADDFDKALESASRALLLDQRQDEARLVVARVHAQQGNTTLAEELLTTLTDSPTVDKGVVFWQLARLALEKEEWALALEHLNESLEMRSTFAPALNDRGYVFAVLQRWDEAETDFRSAAASAPRLGEAHLNLANLLIDRDLASQALPSLKEAAASGVEEPAYALAAGRYYALDASTSTGRARALAYLEKALDLLTHGKRGEVQRAIEKLKSLPAPIETGGSIPVTDVETESGDSAAGNNDGAGEQADSDHIRPAPESPPASAPADDERNGSSRREQPSELERYLPSVK